jgi:hypothetical protein
VRKMADKKNQEERLEMVMNHLGESVLAQSDTAILAESREAGVDPQVQAEQTRLVLRQAARLFNDVNTRLSSLGHVIDANDWRLGQRSCHATWLTCGSYASFTATTGEMRGDALDGICLQADHYAIRRRQGSR